MPEGLDRLTKTRDELFRLVEIAGREGFEEFREKIIGIAEEANRMVENPAEQNLAEQYAPA